MVLAAAGALARSVDATAHALGVALVERGLRLVLNLAVGYVALAALAFAAEVLSGGGYMPVVLDVGEGYHRPVALAEVFEVRHGY